MTTEQHLRENLAAAYRLIAYFGYDDLTFSHLSARVPGKEAFFIQPFGLLFEEVTASSLLTVDFDGNVLEGKEYQYNRTGYVIHGSIYKNRPDLNAVFHLHTVSGIAVSAMPEGLLPISQWALHFYGNVAYHNYNSLALDTAEHEDPLAKDLGNKKVMFLRNHGTLICGETIHEAFIFTNHLENACKTQVAAMASQQKLIMPDAATCEKTVKDLINFEKDIGQRDWQALLRLLERQGSNYKA
jgi:ribulose-5-phosphate 4-epimerase/fuculose-1-phosphate aldolase